VSETSKAVFLSYASQDAEAARRICESLRAVGVEVWFDQSELRGGDAWDAKIRRQIKECALFVPVISVNTNARPEGYFRLEWKLAVDRSHLLADDHPFLFPVVVDDTSDTTARVPEKFREVQWTRLRLDETPTELAARVARLLGPAVAAEPPRSLERGGVAPRPSSRNPIAIVVLGALAILVAGVVAYLVFRPRRSPEEIAKLLVQVQTMAGSAGAKSAAPVSEARQLVAKARPMFETLDSNRDDFKLAGELLEQAKAKDPTDAEVWAAAALLHWRYLARGWDTSDPRREAARVATQRALRLDPQSFEARFAQAALMAYTGREGAEKEKLLRDLRRERPTDHRVLRELGETLERLDRVRTDEGAVFFDEAAALPGGDPLALYNKSMAYWFAGRTAEAEAAMDASIAQRSFTGALLMKAWYAIILHGDLASAQVTLDRIPPTEMVEDRACYFAYYLHYLKREPDAAIKWLNALPRDWLNDNWYTGPKGRAIGDAMQIAGRPEAAAAEWRAALKLVEAHLAADPANGTLRFNRILLLAKLGEREEAARQFAVELQVDGIDLTRDTPVAPWVTHGCILLGRKAEAIRQLAHGLKRRSRAVENTAARLRLDPQFDPLRDDPEFQRVIEEAEAIERSGAVSAPSSLLLAPSHAPEKP
jgi:tetratricopeptide (TPR) repeat protein